MPRAHAPRAAGASGQPASAHRCCAPRAATASGQPASRVVAPAVPTSRGYRRHLPHPSAHGMPGTRICILASAHLQFAPAALDVPRRIAASCTPPAEEEEGGGPNMHAACSCSRSPCGSTRSGLERRRSVRACGGRRAVLGDRRVRSQGHVCSHGGAAEQPSPRCTWGCSGTRFLPAASRLSRAVARAG